MTGDLIAQITKFWPEHPLGAALDQLYWRAQNRYVALRGDASAGKSTMLNLLLQRPALATSTGQTTACITEIRPVEQTAGDTESRVHVADERLIRARLDELRPAVAAEEYQRYERTVDQARTDLAREGVVFGQTVTRTRWEKDLGYSMELGKLELYSVLVARIIHPVAVGPDHPLHWAVEEGVSFLDLPGDVRGQAFNRILLQEAAGYAPVLELRLWNATNNDRPALQADELLVMTFLDSAEATPTSNYLTSILGTLQDYGRRPFVLSVAIDAPPGSSLVTLPAAVARERLQAWEKWLAEQKNDAAWERLLRAARESLTAEGGGIGLVVDEIRRRVAGAEPQVADTPDAGLQELAQQVLQAARALRAGLVRPADLGSSRQNDRLAKQAEWRRRRIAIVEDAGRKMYGEFGSEPWYQFALIFEGYVEPEDIDQEALVTTVGRHADDVQQAMFESLGIAPAPVALSRLAAPLIEELGELTGLLADQRSLIEWPSWADVARVRWELTNLLARMAIGADRQSEDAGPEPALPPADFAAAFKQHSLMNGALTRCINWAQSYA